MMAAPLGLAVLATLAPEGGGVPRRVHPLLATLFAAIAAIAKRALLRPRSTQRKERIMCLPSSL